MIVLISLLQWPEGVGLEEKLGGDRHTGWGFLGCGGCCVGKDSGCGEASCSPGPESWWQLGRSRWTVELTGGLCDSGRRQENVRAMR